MGIFQIKVLLFVLAVLFGTNNEAQSITIRASDVGTAPYIEFNVNNFAAGVGGNQWVFTAPVPGVVTLDVVYDEAFGPFQKILLDPVAGQNGTLVEEFKVDGPLPFNNWREAILTDGWIWDSTASLINLDGTPIPGLSISLSTDQRVIWFEFDALPVGSEFRVSKEILWTGAGASSFIDVRESPSIVPIPSAVWLLCTGLIGIVGIRRKFKK